MIVDSDLIKNACIYDTKKEKFVRGDMKFSPLNGKITDIIQNEDMSSINFGDKLIIPGFIDIHTHGAMGFDFMFAKSSEINTVAESYIKNGITTIFPTSITSKKTEILNMVEEVKGAKRDGNNRINIEGIHIEGPYINPKKAGAHELSQIREFDFEEANEILSAILKDVNIHMHMTVAPELKNGVEFIEMICRNGGTISIGHTEADGKTIRNAIEAGATSSTHLFNAMNPIHHRNTGTAAHLMLQDIFVEIIADSIHLSPEIIKLISCVKDYKKIIIVSDSMAAAGLSEGLYTLGNSSVSVSINEFGCGKATITGTDTIAGSTTNIYDELLNFIKFTGMPMEKALLTVTRNPALAVKIYDRKGSIEKGKDADFFIADKNLKIESVYINGKNVKNNII